MPTSARNAYLAKQAQLALSQPSGIVWVESEPKAEDQPTSWIEDFAELAFGKRWQKFINDSDEVEAALQRRYGRNLGSTSCSKMLYSRAI